ncbi:hypothetical protein MUK42_16768 [Musa troglodytarum]|uniref:Uncharacterized protein n=1 Tax=Musa troglodytarum TaxID=320322 RepID=A0A9E7HQ06_9LILI|nr:hypothetical protein MUK42_16768 [Musa troglodytarum]URE38504.1 hypothetical protein MUK42_16768 [Musa troglodytarum]
MMGISINRGPSRLFSSLHSSLANVSFLVRSVFLYRASQPFPSFHTRRHCRGCRFSIGPPPASGRLASRRCLPMGGFSLAP